MTKPQYPLNSSASYDFDFTDNFAEGITPPVADVSNPLGDIKEKVGQINGFDDNPQSVQPSSFSIRYKQGIPHNVIPDSTPATPWTVEQVKQGGRNDLPETGRNKEGVRQRQKILLALQPSTPCTAIQVEQGGRNDLSNKNRTPVLLQYTQTTNTNDINTPLMPETIRDLNILNQLFKLEQPALQQRNQTSAGNHHNTTHFVGRPLPPPVATLGHATTSHGIDN